MQNLTPPCPKRILGTPNEEIWPSVSSLPDYKPTFPQWSRQDVARIVSTLDEAGIDMLKVLELSNPPFFILTTLFFSFQRTLTYDSAKRISGAFFCSSKRKSGVSYSYPYSSKTSTCTSLSRRL